MEQARILSEILRIAPTLHSAGTFTRRAFEGLVRHALAVPVHHSAETGSGASTLLFSQISGAHTVFALDAGTGSVQQVQGSPLLRREVVTFVEGPTQLTLPRHAFAHPLQLVLIDGPHAYPFPDLEYYYLYPHLDQGALLIIDDIHIPTITNLFDFVAADEMFDLQEVVDTTAFFRRTQAPVFSPTGDGWPMQRYNQRAFESTEPEQLHNPALERVDRATAWYLDQFGALTDPLRLPRVEVSNDHDLIVAGWAVDTRGRTPANAVDLVVDGVTFRAAVRIPRADVASALGDSAYLRSGYSARFAAGRLPRGSHQLELRIVLSGEREYTFAAHLSFTVV